MKNKNENAGVNSEAQCDAQQNLLERKVFITLLLSLCFIKKYLVCHKLLHSLINFSGYLASPMSTQKIKSMHKYMA